MMSNNKILTVSYGTFSCTLEGFDDSFDTMKAIAEYFRDLASEDRYFGAEPPQPDAEMLARIAEKEISRRVEAHERDGGFVLRAGQATAALAAAQAASPARAASNEDQEDEDTEPEAQDTAPAEAAMSDAPHAEPEEAPETVSGWEMPVEEDTEEDSSDFMSAAETAESGFEDEESAADAPFQVTQLQDMAELAAGRDQAPAEAVEEDKAEVEEFIAEPVEAPKSNGFGSIAAKLQRIRDVVARNKAAETVAFDEDKDAEEPLPQAAASAAGNYAYAETDGITVDGDEAEETAEAAYLEAEDVAGTEEEVTPVGDMDAGEDAAEEAAEEHEPVAQDEAWAAPAAFDDAEEAEAAEAHEEVSEVSEADIAEDEAEPVAEEALVETTGEDEAFAIDVEVDEAVVAEDEAVAEAGAGSEYEAFAAEEDTVVSEDTADEEEALVAEADEYEAVATDADAEETRADDLAASEFTVAEQDETETAEDEDTGGTASDEVGTFEISPQEQEYAAAAFFGGASAGADAEPAPETEASAETEDSEAAEHEATVTDLRARVITVKSSVFADYDDDEEDFDTLLSESSLSDEEEAELQRDLAEVEAEIEDDTETAQDDDNAFADLEEAEHDHGHESGSAARLLEEASGPEEDALDRLMAETEHQMEEPESTSRRSAFDHLRAAVAATKADDKLNAERGKTDDDAYRSDLANAVKPRRPAHATDPRLRRPGQVLTAPLKLVAEQRVDTQDRRTGPVRPRRIAQAEGFQAAEVDNFADYAAARGATELPQLLEAAASYLSFVEGHDQFSRPQLMGKLRQVDGGEFNREDSLRIFGQLLRSGKIEKIRGGRFTVSEDIGFRPDDQRAAG